MADRKVEPVEHSDEHQPTSSQNDPKDAQSTSSLVPEGTQPPASTSNVRNTILDEVVANQDKQIAELERKVEKKKETIRKLSLPSPFIPPPGLSVVTPHIPPSTVPQASVSLTSPAVRPQVNKSNPSPAGANTADSSQQQPHHSQPLAHNPAMAATVAAMAAASTPVSTPLHPHFSFFPYPHPDNHVMTFGVVPALPPHPAPQPPQPPNSATPSQPNQSPDDGANRQSRYWTPDEHQRFLAGRRTYGPRNYQQIAEVVGTRNAKQVRTHSQKYQQKLEREEARRRGDSRISSDVHSSVRAVAPKVTASSDGNSAPAPKQTRQSNVHRNGSSSASGKNSQSHEAPHSSKSAEGSSSANNGTTEEAAENSINAVHANAAARAVVAEAVALSRGKLPPEAIMMLEKPCGGQSQHSNPQAQSVSPTEAIADKQDSCRAQSAPTGMNATGSVTAAQNGKQLTSHAANHLSKHSSNSSPCADAQVTTPIPAGKDIHPITEPGHEKQLAKRELPKASSGEQSNPSVNGTPVQLQQRAGQRSDRKQGRSAVKIEPRIVSSATRSGTSSGSHHGAKPVTQSNLTSQTETKSTVDLATMTVNTNGSAGRIENKDQRAVIKAKPAEEVKTAMDPKKQSLLNGQHPSADSSEVKSGEGSQKSKIRDSPCSPKSNTLGEVQCDSDSPPKPNGSARTSNSGVTLDTRDINGRTLPRTEAVETKDEVAECLASKNSMVICADQGKAKDTKNNADLRSKDEMRAPTDNKQVASSSTLTNSVPNGGENKIAKDGQAMGSEASQERKREDYVDGIKGAETTGVETGITGITPNGDVHKVSKNGKSSTSRGDGFEPENKGIGSEQVQRKGNKVGEDDGEGKGCDKTVEPTRDKQDMKRRLEDMTESTGKRQKV